MKYLEEGFVGPLLGKLENSDSLDISYLNILFCFVNPQKLSHCHTWTMGKLPVAQRSMGQQRLSISLRDWKTNEWIRSVTQEMTYRRIRCATTWGRWKHIMEKTDGQSTWKRQWICNKWKKPKIEKMVHHENGYKRLEEK